MSGAALKEVVWTNDEKECLAHPALAFYRLWVYDATVWNNDDRIYPENSDC
jgi:hypothetical protein